MIRSLITDAARTTADAVTLAIRRFKPDLVLRHHISFATRWVCQRDGVPCAVGALSPLFWFSREDPGVYRPLLGMIDPPSWLRRGLNRFGRLRARRVIDSPLNRVRRELGFPPVRDLLFEECLEGVVNLGLWSPRFRPPARDDPSNAVTCGYCRFDRSPGVEHAPEEVEQFLNECDRAGQPSIVIALGSTIAHHGKDLYLAAAKACHRLGRRALLLTADPRRHPVLPPGIHAVGYAPYRSVFPRAAAILHHGGAGTTGAALAAGKPTVIIPFANDEFDNASRVRRLGVSLTLRPARASARNLAKLLQTALADLTRDQAARFAPTLAAESGPATAAAALEAALSRPSTASQGSG